MFKTWGYEKDPVTETEKDNQKGRRIPKRLWFLRSR